jgi:hypothetical protein
LVLLLELETQATHVHVDRALVTVEIEAPHAFEQRVSRQRDAWIGREREEERVFARLEGDGLPVDPHLARGFVDLEPSEAVHGRLRIVPDAAAPQDRPAATSRGENGFTT